MKKAMGIIMVCVLIAGAVGMVYTSVISPHHANACNWGSSGGGDYVPQKRGYTERSFKAPTMTKEQAFDVVDNHIKKLNPTLEIGKIIDNGGFYEAEVLSEKGEIVERVGVDKRTGRLLVMN